MVSSSLLFADRPDDIKRVREVLDAAGFTAEGVGEVMGANGFSFLADGELAPLLRRTQGGSPLETLVRLFVCGVPVQRAAAEDALVPMTLAEWESAEMVSVDGVMVTGQLKLAPYDLSGNHWIFPNDTKQRQDTADHVMAPNAGSVALAGMTVRRSVARCLDLGTGSGVQAMYASTHAQHVVATDMNERAVAFTAFAAALNSVGNVEAREGDLFEPVAGERFGLIVSNPPFVISPESRLIYRDSGLPGDEVCRRIVAEAPTHLEEGGWCQLMANWAHLAGTDWRERLGGWLDGTACDAWVIQLHVYDCESYASYWTRRQAPDPGSERSAFDVWMDHYERTGTEAIGFGLISLRRTGRGKPWRRVEELPDEPVLPCGDAIADTFARAIWLAELGDDDRRLLDVTLLPNPTLDLHEHRQFSSGQWVVKEASLQQEDALRFAEKDDGQVAQLVARCDGSSTVGELLRRQGDAAGIDFAEIVPDLLPIVRRLIEKGFLTPDSSAAG